MSDLVQLSKFLSTLLRHRADQFGLVLDEHGFADTDQVWAQVQRRYGSRYQLADLLKVVAGDVTGKKRFEIQGRHIRALYGHSAVRDITYEPVIPPTLLYHGTTSAALESIRRDGLKHQRRQYVHLAIHRDRAAQVAARHAGTPILLTVRAAEAHRAGIQFYQPETEHFLADDIPVEFIDFPPEGG